MSDADRARERAHGRWLYQTHASRPEVVAKSQTPAARAAAAAACTETVMGWCPHDRRDEYRRLVRAKVPAAEARRVIEAEIPGTAEYAKRELANIALAAKLRRERDVREAY